MTQKAFVENNLIRDIGPHIIKNTDYAKLEAPVDPTLISYPDKVVVDVADAARVGWTWNGTTATAPVVATPDPLIRTAPGPTLVKAMTDAQWAAVKPRDQACIAGRDDLAENLDMIARAAGKAGITPKTWFDLALGVVTSTS